MRTRDLFPRWTMLVGLALAASLLATLTTPAPPPARAAGPTCTISAKLVNSCRPWPGAESGAGDDTPPTMPTVMAVLSAPDEATVTWSDASDNVAVTGYRVYRGSTLVGTVTDGSGRLVEGGLGDGTTYSYRVVAFDAAGNSSTASDPIAVTTPDVTAPTTPLDLRATSSSQSVAFTWRAATDNVGVDDYVVYRDGLPLATLGGAETSYTDTAPVGDTLHRYRVLARDAAGNASGLSNEVARTLADTVSPSAPTRQTASPSRFSTRLA